jgi:Mn2+/Fe2+ NRAMP family transporter
VNDAYLPLESKELPEAPHWSKALGVGIVAMGLAIGTGELILWPHLVTKHGLGILWTALLGITFQYFINQEVARLALARGESFFTTSSRLFKWLAPFWLVAAMVLYIWPGWASALGTIAAEIFGVGDYKIWAWICLGIILILTLTGKSAYQVLEKFLRIIVPTFFILLVISSILTLSFSDLIAAGSGLLNFGGLPLDIDPNVLLAYVGHI